MVPDAKLIAASGPGGAAWSHYRARVRKDFAELLSFEDAIAAEPDRLRGERERVLETGYRSYALEQQSYVSFGCTWSRSRVWKMVPVGPGPDRSNDMMASYPGGTYRIGPAVPDLPDWSPREFRRA